MSNVRYDTDAKNHVDQEPARPQVARVSTENLYRLWVPVRAEIRKVCLAPPVVEEANAKKE